MYVVSIHDYNNLHTHIARQKSAGVPNHRDTSVSAIWGPPHFGDLQGPHISSDLGPPPAIWGPSKHDSH